ncbi:hypothetical protein [Natronorubrum sp. A-ect3]|uniref:hypothetical protein n=1 Tax=Natronorubrum sp. A-ect3 TaxID=3242698 RepID=UPI00359D09EB
MDRHSRSVKRVKRTILALLIFGTIGFGLWIGIRQSTLYDPIAEVPLVLAITCLLGTVSLFVLRYTARKIVYRIESSKTEQAWVVKVGNFGIAVVLSLVGASFIALLNGVLYFLFDRDWPVSPAQVGEIQFFFLVGIVLTPVVVGALAASLLIHSS